MLSVNLIGAGKLGKTIGALITQHKAAMIKGVVTNSPLHSRQAIEFIGEGCVYPTIQSLPHANITLIATPDDAIVDCGKLLSSNDSLMKGDIVLHCSGSLSSTHLFELESRGCLVASVHPMRSFNNPKLSVDDYPGTYCAIEGSAEGLPLLTELFTKIGSITFTIDKEKKSLYHSANVIASNYLLALAQEALDCLSDAGVNQSTAMPAINSLMRSTLSNLDNSLSPKDALTGPIQRGDIATVQKNLAALSNPFQQQLYGMLGKKILTMSALSDEKKQAFHQIFSRTTSLSENVT